MKVTYTIIKRWWLRKPYRWIAQGANNEVIAKSSSGYHNRKDAEDCIKLLKSFPEAPINYKEDTIVPKKYRKVVGLILILLSLTFITQAQSYYLKVADKPDYALYEKYCNDTIQVDIWQYGHVPIHDPKTPGLDFQLMKAVVGEPPKGLLGDTIWWAVWHSGKATGKRTYQSSDWPVQRIVKIWVPRRVPSIKDYYENWKTNKIYHPIGYQIDKL